MGEQLRGVLPEEGIKMGGDCGAGVNDRVAQGSGVIALGGFNPEGVEAEGGFPGNSLNLAMGVSRINGQFSIRADFSLGPHHAL